GEDVGLSEHFVSQAVVFLLECGNANLDAVTEEARNGVSEDRMNAAGIERADRVVLQLVDVFVPNGDAEGMGHSLVSRPRLDHRFAAVPFAALAGKARPTVRRITFRYGQFRRVCRGRCRGGWW